MPLGCAGPEIPLSDPVANVPSHRALGLRTPTVSPAGSGAFRTSHPPPGACQAGEPRQSPTHLLLLSVHWAQKQCAQAPGEIHILIQVSCIDEGGGCHLRILTAQNEALGNKREGGKKGGFVWEPRTQDH